MKGYSTAIWIIGSVLLLIILAYIISYGVKEGLIKLGKEKYEASEIKDNLPLLPSLIFVRKRKKGASFINILFLIILGILIVGILAYMMYYYSGEGKEVSEAKPQTSSNYMECVQSCSIKSQDYEVCVQRCVSNEKESNN